METTLIFSIEIIVGLSGLHQDNTQQYLMILPGHSDGEGGWETGT